MAEISSTVIWIISKMEEIILLRKRLRKVSEAMVMLIISTI